MNLVRSCSGFELMYYNSTKEAAQIGEDAVKPLLVLLYKVPISKVHSLPSCIDFATKWNFCLSITENLQPRYILSVFCTACFGFWSRCWYFIAILQKSIFVSIFQCRAKYHRNVSVAAGIGLYEVLKQRPQIL